MHAMSACCEFGSITDCNAADAGLWNQLLAFRIALPQKRDNSLSALWKGRSDSDGNRDLQK